MDNGLGSKITSVRNEDGRLEVFVIGTDNQIWHTWQMAPNSGWSYWYALGGNMTGLPAEVVSGANASGALEIITVLSDKTMVRNWQVAPNIGWNQD
jgi:hypothetical protein